jgi:ribokinase
MTSRPLVVVGSINQDSFAFVSEHPRPGETILATSSLVSLGGKGCNQAMAASLAGADVYFVGAVGADAAGDFALATLRDGGVDVSGITRLPDVATGVAYITVDEAGENTIVVASGANARVTADAASAGLTTVLDSLAARDEGSDPILLVQGELPAEVNVAVAAIARERGLSFVLNLAPVSHVDAPTISTSSPLVVNENEGADLLGSDGAPADVARGLHERYGIPVVITVGPEGAIIADETGLSRQPSPVPSAVVDTTGAGDAFVGVLAAALCGGAPLRAAARRAVVAASHAVESAGTVTSYASAAELEPLLARAPEAVAV